MSEVTKEYLAALRALCDAATPEPWRADDLMGDENSEPMLALYDGHGRCIAGFADDDEEGIADGHFIAAARTAMPKLIARVEQDAESHALSEQLLHSNGKEIDKLKATIERLEACIAELVGTLMGCYNELENLANSICAHSDHVTDSSKMVCETCVGSGEVTVIIDALNVPRRHAKELKQPCPKCQLSQTEDARQSWENMYTQLQAETLELADTVRWYFDTGIDANMKLALDLPMIKALEAKDES